MKSAKSRRPRASALDPSSAMPKYYRFAELICNHYLSLPLGSQLPRIADLAQRYRVSKETINRSMRYLAGKGFVVSERGRGTTLLRSFHEAFPASGASLPGAQPPSNRSRSRHAQGVGLMLIPREVTPSPFDNFLETEILAGMQHRLLEEGLYLAHVVVDEKADCGLQRQLEGNPALAGFIFMVQMLTPETARLVARSRRPAVVVNDDTVADQVASVVADEVQGFGAALQHLQSLGHRRIGFVSSVRPNCAVYRLASFTRAASEFGILLEDNLVFTAEGSDPSNDPPTVLALARRILDTKPACTAVVTSAGGWGLSLAGAFPGLGVRLGRDLSLIVFGTPEREVTITERGHGRLTTITKPRYEIGQRAVDMLLAQADHGYTQDGTIRLPMGILVGDTTGPAPVAG